MNNQKLLTKSLRMPIEKLRPHFAFDDQRIQLLKKIAPECFADGKINWETLKEALGNYTEEEGADAEHFGLFWPGKKEARKLASTPSRGTLAPMPNEGLDEEITRNIFIEGENLEVLKILQKSYSGRIKMIYIDPPYNTGNDFVYDDNFTETIEEYLKRTGQIDEEGRKLVTNSKADGRFHSKWLSMMYPRLRLARNLLKKNGFIFISIDDNEVQNLKLLLNELFGEENFIVQFIWKSRVSEDTRAVTGVSTDHEYILLYTKNAGESLRGANKDLEKFTNPDDDPRGPWRSADLTGLATKDKRPNLHYDLIDPRTNINYGCPPKGWRYERKTMNQKITENRILFPTEKTGRPRHKLYLNELKSNFKNISSIITSTNTSAGTKELNTLLGQGVFSFPKPSDLIKVFVEQCTLEDDIILDFFGGSGTTAQAVLKMSSEDNMQRRWVIVQLPEIVDGDIKIGKTRINKLSEITIERIKRASLLIKKELKNDNMDFGVKVFKLQKSNYKVWENLIEPDIDKLELEFEKFQSPLVATWEEEHLLTEVMLIEGFPLDSRIEENTSHKKNNLKIVSSDFCEHSLFICLDKRVYGETIKALCLGDNDIFICLDNAITDEQKVMLSDKGLIKTI
jgi:adenine-specific DNA-methyltransferase